MFDTTSALTESPSIELPESLLQAIYSTSPSEGLTHTFYRYPARFSPAFARTAIAVFSEPGDVVLDPFMGSGTSLVEAIASGRHAIGSDINPLAQFVASAKTTAIPVEHLTELTAWGERIVPALSLHRNSQRPVEWIEQGYQRHLPWRIRKLIELILSEVQLLSPQSIRDLARCALLKTAQWALDCTTKIPDAAAFRKRFQDDLAVCTHGVAELTSIRNAFADGEQPKIVCLGTPAAELDPLLWQEHMTARPKLVVTSPPYPQVHVLYHRWQINGRRETPAPYWIIGSPDGKGASYYTMGSRSPLGLENYFRGIESAFARLHQVMADDATVVQLVAFSDVESQLPRYLDAMTSAGYREAVFQCPITGSEGSRVWRQVPLRRWYASFQGLTSSSRELLLIHKRA